MVTRPERGALVAFGGILVVLFLVSTNLTVVGTALPRIIAELDGFHLYAWAFTAFILTSTVSLPVFGRLSDTYGRKRLLLLGIVLFSVASAAAGFAQTMGQLVLLRAVQGVGGGALMAMTWAVLADLFTPRQRGAYQGYTSAVFGVSSVIGPVIGGVITDTLGWRWVFFVNVPIALLAFEVVRRTLPPSPRAAGGRVDAPGAVLLTVATVPLLLALSWGGIEVPWTHPLTIALIALSIVAGAAFVWWERRAQAPIIPPSLFADRTFAVAALATGLLGAAMFAAVIYLPLFVQGVAGGSAAASGFALAPLMGGFVVASALSGLAATRWGRYRPWIIGASAVTVVGALLAARLGPDSGVSAIVTASVVLGLGLGPTISLYVLAVQNTAAPAVIGTVTSAIQFFRQIGGMLGVAAFGSVVTARLQAGLEASSRVLAGASAETIELASSPNTLTEPARTLRLQELASHELGPGASETLLATMRGALDDGLGWVFLLSAALAAVAVVVGLRLPDRPLTDTERASSVDEPPPDPRPTPLERQQPEVAGTGTRQAAFERDLVGPPGVGGVPDLEPRRHQLTSDLDRPADGGGLLDAPGSGRPPT